MSLDCNIDFRVKNMHDEYLMSIFTATCKTQLFYLAQNSTSVFLLQMDKFDY